MAGFQDALFALSNIEKNLNDATNSVFLNNKTAWVKEITDEYIKYNVDPNTTISKIAAEHSLNGDQIQRLVEDTNVAIYLDKYAATKGQKVRRVEFELADPSKVNANIETHASDGTMDFGLEKVASEDTGAFNAFTMDSGKYEPSLWDKESMQKNAAEMLKRKLTPRIVEERKAAIGSVRDLLSKIACIADSLIYNERAEGTASDLLSKIAEDANLDLRTASAIVKCAYKKVDEYKEARTLPGNFELNFEAKEKLADDFSLGRHSLSKQAETEYVVKARHLPDRMTYEKLVHLAREVKQELDKQEGNGPITLKVVK